MELTSSKKIDTNKYELMVKVSSDEFAPALDRAFRRNVPKMNIPGFRKGKAPKAIVYKMFGDGVFYEDAVNELYPKAYAQALEEAKIEPVAYPQIDVTSVDQSGFTFKAEVVTKPEVEISDYKGITAVKAVKTVGESDVSEDLERQRKRNARTITVTDRAAQDGDVALIDFEGFVDGEAFDGGKGENHSLKLGAGQFIPGFEAQVVGHQTGDAFDVNVTFPDDYHEELKGKSALFKVTLHEIKEEQLPELDDEFAKDVSELDTLDQLRESIRARLQEQQDKETQTEFENALVDQVVAKMKAEIPGEMVEHKIEELMHDYEYRLQSQGIPMDMYMQYTNQTLETLKESFREGAEKQVRIRLALEKIVELENITPTDEEIEAEYVKLAEQYRNDIEKLKSAIPAKEIQSDLAVQKAIDMIRDSAVVVEAPAQAITNA